MTTATQQSLDFSAPVVPDRPADTVPIDPAFNRLVDYLRAHNRSPAEAISASNLAIFLDIGPRDGRQVRRLISLYRDRAPSSSWASPAVAST